MSDEIKEPIAAEEAVETVQETVNVVETATEKTMKAETKDRKNPWAILGLLAGIVALGLVVVMCISMQGMQKKLNELQKKANANADLVDGINEIEDRAKQAVEESAKTNKTIDALLKVASSVLDIDLTNLDDINIEEIYAQIYGVHEIWDDTEVVNAYKTGDTSKITDAKDRFVLEKATEVLDQIIKDGMTDYEKEKAVYEWLVMYTSLDPDNMGAIAEASEYSHMPYGVLKYHQAICVGDATTFAMFMHMLDIECMIIHSVTQGEHAWDLVKIGDGWYHVDVLFDGGSDGRAAYAFFNVPDSVKKESGYPWSSEEFPAADSYEYCYMVQEATKLDDIYNLPKLLYEAIRKEQVGSKVIVYEVDKTYTEEVEDIISMINGQYLDQDHEYLYLENYLTINDNYYISVMYVNSQYEDPETETGYVIPDVDYEKIREELSKYFGEPSSDPFDDIIVY